MTASGLARFSIVMALGWTGLYFNGQGEQLMRTEAGYLKE